ncbi:cation diffusion facilitator family transporter [Microcella humidisoli]|uniref:Cation diffusion facilitator family transporter n=1 Tax=Microcella humidisoli TaxID=2963406 RepID=A0ABY5FYM7_9MICO|nr:cation diffusion facilitator family transporter [Microcella humidisoli]UTT63236.1 cation diffusion facilitator family transporter [Microcella humidisoli]
MSADGHTHAGGTINHLRLAIAFGLTASVLVAEVIGAIITGSLALLVDAAHMLTDAGGLLVALFAAKLMERPATSRRTWGLRRAEVLAATVQAAVLLGVGVFVVIEAVQRFSQPAEIASVELLVFGIVGLLANIIAIVVLSGGRGDNLNMRAAFLEVLNDALGSVAVIVAAVVIMTTGFQQADSIAALLVGVLIIPRTLRLLRDAVDVLLESVPRGIDLADVRQHLLDEDHVVDVHDLHITQIATGLPVLTAHVVVEAGCFHDGHAPEITQALQRCVAEHFPVAIDHATFQLEPAGAVQAHDMH